LPTSDLVFARQEAVQADLKLPSFNFPSLKLPEVELAVENPYNVVSGVESLINGVLGGAGPGAATATTSVSAAACSFSASHGKLMKKQVHSPVSYD
jgi:hypothetical protein